MLAALIKTCLSWNIAKVRYDGTTKWAGFKDMFSGSGLSNDNYDALLIGWSQLPNLKENNILDALNNQYCASTEARNILINELGWIINDAGVQENCSANERALVTIWKTDNNGVSNSNQITIPINERFTYEYDINWGDGTSDTGVSTSITHTYNQPGTYEVEITGVFPQFYFIDFNQNTSDANKILDVKQWGDIAWSSMEYAFTGCQNLQISANDIPNLSSASSLSFAFYKCVSLTNNASLENWNVSNISDMQSAFSNSSFNQNLENWNISRVWSMNHMFDNSALSDENYEKMLIA